MSGATTERRTAAYTWQDLAADHGTIGYGTFNFADADPGRLPFDSPVVNKASRREGIGAVMCWCQSTDPEGGTLIMLTGQTQEQEGVVLRNVSWMTSCGVVYSIARCGDKSYKTMFDHRIKIGDKVWRIWLIPNDHHVEGYR